MTSDSLSLTEKIQHNTGYSLTTILLPAIVALAVVLFGSVEEWSFALVTLIIIVSFNILLYKMDFNRLLSRFWYKILLISIGGFLFVSLLQIVPIPLGLLKIFSPSKYTLMSSLSFSKVFGSLSIYPYATLNKIFHGIVYFMLFLMAAFVVRDKKSIKRILFFLTIFGFVLSLFAIVQKAAWNGKIYWLRDVIKEAHPFGPFVNRNHFAGFIGMVIPLGLGLAFDSKLTEKKLFFVFFSIVMAAAIFFSLSRGGMVSFTISTGVFFFLISYRSSKLKAIVYMLSFMFIFILFMFTLETESIKSRLDHQGFTEGTRLIVWKSSMEIIKDYPITGTGLGTFKYIIPKYYPSVPGGTPVVYYVHNDYLHLLVETGILGTFFIIVFFAALAICIFKAIGKRGLSPLMTGLISSISYMAIHSIFDFNLHIPSNALMFSLITGLLVSYTVRRTDYHLNRTRKRV